MKQYTLEEKEEAKKKLPEPTVDFINSGAITQGYLDIAKKHTLNLRQIAAISDIVEAILLNLEQEKSLEGYIREAVPELPGGKVSELIVSINERIFREARQRLAGNAVPVLKTEIALPSAPSQNMAPERSEPTETEMAHIEGVQKAKEIEQLVITEEVREKEGRLEVAKEAEAARERIPRPVHTDPYREDPNT